MLDKQRFKLGQPFGAPLLQESQILLQSLKLPQKNLQIDHARPVLGGYGLKHAVDFTTWQSKRLDPVFELDNGREASSIEDIFNICDTPCFEQLP